MLSNQQRYYVFCFLFFYLAAGRLSVDIVAPVLNTFSTSFSISFLQAKQLISFYIIGFGVGQIPTGIFLDKISVKTIIIAGLFLYIAGNLISNIASSINILLFARFITGLGAAVGSTTSKYIVQNLYKNDPKGFARIWSIISISLILSMLCGPLLGLLISKISTVRMIFISGAFYGILLLLFFMLIKKHLILNTVIHNTRTHLHIFKDPRIKAFISFTAITATALSSLVLAIQNYPHIIEFVGLSSNISAILIVATGTGYLSSTLFFNKWLHNIKQTSLLKFVCPAFILPAFFILMFIVIHSIIILLISAYFLGITARLIIPNALALALSNIKTIKSGVLVAMVGTTQMLTAGLFSYVDTLINHNPLIIFPIELIIIGSLSTFFLHLALRHQS